MVSVKPSSARGGPSHRERHVQRHVAEVRDRERPRSSTLRSSWTRRRSIRSSTRRRTTSARATTRSRTAPLRGVAALGPCGDRAVHVPRPRVPGGAPPPRRRARAPHDALPRRGGLRRGPGHADAEPEAVGAGGPDAGQLVESLEEDFDPAAYSDTYREAVVDLIKRKAAGEEAPREGRGADRAAALLLGGRRRGRLGGAAAGAGRRRPQRAGDAQPGGALPARPEGQVPAPVRDRHAQRGAIQNVTHGPEMCCTPSMPP
jgi:hypothetical protein